MMSWGRPEPAITGTGHILSAPMGNRLLPPSWGISDGSFQGESQNADVTNPPAEDLRGRVLTERDSRLPPPWPQTEVSFHLQPLRKELNFPQLTWKRKEPIEISSHFSSSKALVPLVIILARNREMRSFIGNNSSFPFSSLFKTYQKGGSEVGWITALL